jgi:exopolysaccharide biosynthesis protein
MNASFFRISADYKPLGYYKTKDTIIDIPVPKLYKNAYGMICINEQGLLEIIPKIDEKIARNYTQVLTTGPILVDKGKIIMTESMMITVDNNVYKYVCTDKSMLQARPIVPLCNDIKPGEFSHASNPNPRSAIALDKQNNVYFVYVEGRGARGDGMDLNQLAELCKNNFNAVTAINLDGGASSQLICKTPSKIVQFNPDHNFSYPVGTVIAIIK